MALRQLALVGGVLPFWQVPAHTAMNCSCNAQNAELRHSLVDCC